jgi:hypothetical protein
MEHVEQMDENEVTKSALEYKPRELKNIRHWKYRRNDLVKQ